MDPLSVALEAIPKALVYAAVILSVGVPAARLLFLTRVGGREWSALAAGPGGDSGSNDPAGPGSHDVRVAFDSSLARLAVFAAVGLLGTLLLRAWGHTAVSFGIADAFSSDNVILIAWESQWGQAWKLQVAGAATLAVFAWATTQVPQLAWPLTSIVALSMCFLLPLMGHAEGEPSRVLLHGSHILGAGVWVGTLMTMAFAVPRTLRPLMLRAFAPFAFVGSGMLVVSGLVATWTYLGSPTNLVNTTYGWMLALKLVFVADVAIFGFLNWRRFHRPPTDVSPTSGAHAAPRELFLMLEVLTAIAVIAVTAILTETDHP